MIASDEDALICDLAETYGIWNYRALPVRTLAALASGLREDSRSKRNLSGVPVEQTTLLLAMAVDALHYLVWSRTRAAQKGGRPPESIAGRLLHRPGSGNEPPLGFASGAEFDAAWKAAVKGVREHGN